VALSGLHQITNDNYFCSDKDSFVEILLKFCYKYKGDIVLIVQLIYHYYYI